MLAETTSTYAYWVVHVRDLSLPMFVVFSSLLFWRRVNWDEQPSLQLKNYLKRLLLLLLGWSVVLLPFWLHRYMMRYPDDWAVYLVPKLILYGGCRGGYFIMSLVYGTTLVYVLHRYCGKIVPFVLLFLVNTSYDLVHIMGMRVKMGFLDSNYLCFRFLFYIEMCVWFIPWLAGKLSRLNAQRWLWISLAVFLALCAIRNDFVSYFVVLFFLIIISALLYNLRCDKLPSWSVTLRNMSIVVYLLHFVVIDYGELALLHFTGIDLTSYGPIVEYVVVLAVTLPLAYVVAVPLARRFPLVKRWLL